MHERSRFARQLFVRRRAVIPEVFVGVGLYDLLAGQLPQEWPLPHLGDVIEGLPFGAVVIFGLLLLLVVSVEGGYREKRDEAERRETAEKERDEFKPRAAAKPRRIDASALSVALTDSLLGFNQTYQVYAPYGDDEAHTFAEDISRVLRVCCWQGSGDGVERQLYEGPPVYGVEVWRPERDPHQVQYASKLKDFLEALGFGTSMLEGNQSALGLGGVMEIHVRAQER